jgi:hypothetical protein
MSSKAVRYLLRAAVAVVVFMLLATWTGDLAQEYRRGVVETAAPHWGCGQGLLHGIMFAVKKPWYTENPCADYVLREKFGIFAVALYHVRWRRGFYEVRAVRSARPAYTVNAGRRVRPAGLAARRQQDSRHFRVRLLDGADLGREVPSFVGCALW